MESRKKEGKLKIRFVPYEKFKVSDLGVFLEGMHDNTIVLIDAKLTPEEEANLIKETMKKVSNTFSGIELNSLELSNSKSLNNIEKIKNVVIEKIIGKKRGLTIIGPAKTVRQIKKNPEELLLYM